MSTLGQVARYETLRSLGHASVGAGFTAIGTAFLNPVRILMVDNSTDVNLIISFDGINNHMFIAANSGRVIDYASDAELPVGKLSQAADVIVYAKEESGGPTVGNVYVSVVYAFAGNY
ncbi:MAG: hypothetical protein ACHQVS_00595 [Candidatus Babeliales bacterium]